jgi:hypothetical protein
LGANRRKVLELVLRGASALLCVGLVIGIPVAWQVDAFVTNHLYGVKSHDPATLALRLRSSARAHCWRHSFLAVAQPRSIPCEHCELSEWSMCESKTLTLSWIAGQPRTCASPEAGFKPVLPS